MRSFPSNWLYGSGTGKVTPVGGSGLEKRLHTGGRGQQIVVRPVFAEPVRERNTSCIRQLWGFHFNTEIMSVTLDTFRTLGLALLASVVGGIAARMTVPEKTVHAQENYSGLTSCVTEVPKSWGTFKGGSEYGLAFEDGNGVLRFVLHPSCGSTDSRSAPSASLMDLEVQRR